MITPWRGRLRYQPGEFLPAGHATAIERAGQLGLVVGAVSTAPAGFTGDWNHAGTRCQGSHCNRALRAPVRHTNGTSLRRPFFPNLLQVIKLSRPAVLSATRSLRFLLGSVRRLTGGLASPTSSSTPDARRGQRVDATLLQSPSVRERLLPHP